MMVFKFLLVLMVVLCVLLVLIILAQNPKGGGLSSSISGGNGGQMFGVQQTNKFLINTTWGIAIAIVLIVLFSNFVLEKTPNQKDIIQLPPVEDFESREKPDSKENGTQNKTLP